MTTNEAISESTLVSPEPEISCLGCGAEPKARELLDWHQRGLYWARSVREQLLCDTCFALLPRDARREWIPVGDLIVD